MKQIYRATQFKKDVKRLEKQGKDFAIFKEILTQLAQGFPLAEKYRDHMFGARRPRPYAERSINAAANIAVRTRTNLLTSFCINAKSYFIMFSV